MTAPTQYAEGLFDPILLSAPRPIKAERVPFDSPTLSTGCDVIYLGNITAAQRQNFMQRISGNSILSISENDSECSAGSAFCLQIDGDQASFKVNLDARRAAACASIPTCCSWHANRRRRYEAVA